MEHSNSKKRGEGLRVFFRRNKESGGSPSSEIQPSLGPDGQSHSLIEASNAIPAHVSVSEKPDIAEAIMNLGGLPEDKRAPFTNGDVGSQSQETGHEDGTPIVGSSTALPSASNRDLWADAWEMLDEESRERLDRERKGRSAMENSKYYVQKTIDETKKALEHYQRKSGPIAQVADIGKKILASAFTVKQFLDAGAKFDPTGYGACAWAVLSFGLTLIENANTSKRLAFEAAATLSGLLADYNQTEIRYLRISPSTGARESTKELENALVDAYAAILKYSAAVAKTTHGSRRDRVGDSFIALIGEPLVDLKITIQKQDIIVTKWKDHVKHEYDLQFQNIVLVNQEQIEAEVNKAFNLLETIHDDITVARDDVAFLAGSELLDWLSPPKNSSNMKHEELRALEEGVRQPRAWFTQSQGYRQWKDTDRSLLYLFAPKGCGKSSLCSSIIDHLSALNEDEAVVRQKLVAFWYFQSKEATKDLRPMVLRSILRQLCSSSSHAVPKDIKEWLTQASSRSWPLNRKDLLGKIRNVVAMLSLDVFIVLDGIDEIPTSPAVKNGCTREQVLELVSDLIRLNERNPKLHILLSSSPDDDIRKVLLGEELKSVVDFMNVESGLQEDLLHFIEKTMQSDKKFKDLKPNIQSAVRDRLSGGKEKSFLWATLMLDELRQYDGDGEEIMKHLQDVPPSLAAEYRKCLASVKDHYKEKVRMMLMWLLWHQQDSKPLTEQEMIVAARLKDSSPSDAAKQVIALVRMSTPIFGSVMDGDEDDQDRQFRHIEFVHFSAKEYLKAIPSKPTQMPSDRSEADIRWPPSFLEEEAHLQMATQCLEALLEMDEDDRPKGSPLKRYAAQYWHTHYLKIRETRTPGQKDAEKTRAEQKILEEAVKQKAAKLEELDRLVETLLTPDSKEAAFRSWLGLHDPDVQDSSSNLDMNRDDDNDSSSNSDLDSHSDRNSHDDRSEDANSPAHPVYYAVKLKLLNVAARLIKKHQVDPDERPGKEGTMLQLALSYGHWEVASLLLDYYNGQDKIVNDESGPHGTALYIASANADDQAVNIVHKLISKGARADRAEEGKYGSALHAAAYFGRYATVQALVDKGKASVNQEGGVFGTALNTAAAKGHEEVVKLLLSYKASPMTVSGLFGTALQASLVCDLHSSASVCDLLQEALGKPATTSSSWRGVGWQSAFNRLYNCNSELFELYTWLFSKPVDLHIPLERELTLPQIALASVLELWHLPGAAVLNGFRHYLLSLPYRTPYGEPLEDILRVLPDFDNCADELNRQDFCYKGLFWSGINYILANLDLLIHDAIKSMITAFQRAGNFSKRESELLYGWEDRYLYLFQPYWMDHARMRRDENYWVRLAPRRSLRHIFRRNFKAEPWARHFTYEYDVDKDEDMDLSDKFALEMGRKQQLRQKYFTQTHMRDGRTVSLAKTREDKLSSARNSRSEIATSPNHSDDNDSDSSNDNDHENDDDSVSKNFSNNVSVIHSNDSDDGGFPEIFLVVDDLLPLVKKLVEFGKQCDQLHETANIATEMNAQIITDLTFEVLAAVARLVVSMRESLGERQRTIAIESTLAQTVQLIRSVRLPRITRLATAARSQQLSYTQNGDSHGDENGVIIKTGSATPSSAGSDSRPLLDDTATTTTILQELPGLVRDHVSSVMDRVRNEMCENLENIVRDAVRNEIERRQEVSDGVSLSPSENRQSRGWAGYFRRFIG